MLLFQKGTSMDSATTVKRFQILQRLATFLIGQKISVQYEDIY